jgi:hypothetical protein
MRVQGFVVVHQLPVVQREPPLLETVARPGSRLPQPPLFGEILRQEAQKVGLVLRRIRHLQSVQLGAPYCHVPVRDDLAVFVIDEYVSGGAVLQERQLKGGGVVHLLRREDDVQLGHFENGLRVFVLADEILQRIFRLRQHEFSRVVLAVFFAALHQEAFHVAAGVGLPVRVAELFSLVFGADPLFYQNPETRRVVNGAKISTSASTVDRFLSVFGNKEGRVLHISASTWCYPLLSSVPPGSPPNGPALNASLCLCEPPCSCGPQSIGYR